MTTRYKNFSTHLPIRLWTMPSDPKLFRLELPSVELTTPTEWKFDTKISSIGAWRLYTLQNGQTELYVLNTSVVPPFPKGCLFLDLINNPVYPYNTTMMHLTDFLDTSREQFFVFTYAVPNTLPLYVWMTLDVYNELSTQLFINPDTGNADQRKAIRSQYVSYAIYPFLSVEPYWTATHEYLCIPSSKQDTTYKKKFNTLEECQRQTYPKVKNRHTWVDNGNRPLQKYMQWWNRLPSDRKVQSLLFS